MILGGDYSLWDEVLDWANHTWKFAFIKASEGTATDPVFENQWQAAKEKVYRGAYHFFRPYVSWIDAAQKFAYLLSQDKGELPPILDLEVTDGFSSVNVAEKSLEWLRKVRQLDGRTPMVYTSPDFIFANKLHLFPEFREYALWMAEYPFDKIQGTWTEERRRQRILDIISGNYAYVYPSAPAPWSGKPTFVQWTGKCPPEYVPGYPLGNKLAVDVNFYEHDLETLVAQFDLPPLEGDDDMSTKPITWTADLLSGQQANLRAGAGLTAAIRELMTGPIPFQGTGAKVFANNYWWAEVVLPKSGWIAFTTSFTNVRWIVPEAPPDVPQKKAIKTTIYYNDGSSDEMFPR